MNVGVQAVRNLPHTTIAHRHVAASDVCTAETEKDHEARPIPRQLRAGAAKADDLTKTVDYEVVYKLVQQLVTENRFYLIEKLAYLITGEVLARFDVAEAVEVTVRKANPPVGGTCDRAEAVYRQSRTV